MHLRIVLGSLREANPTALAFEQLLGYKARNSLVGSVSSDHSIDACTRWFLRLESLALGL